MLFGAEKKYLSTYKTVIFLIMSVLFLYFLGKIIDVAVMFFAAFVISASILPLINYLKKYIPRALAVMVVLLLVLVGILLIFIPLTMLTINQIAAFIQDMPNNIEKAVSFFNKTFFGYSINDFIDANGLNHLGDNLAIMAGNVVSQGLSAGKVIANSITSILMLSVMVFYLCMDEDRLKKAFIAFFPPKFKKKAALITSTIQRKVGGFITAQLLTMGGVGILAFIFLSLAGHPHPAIIGFLTFILDFIPVIGSTIAVIIGTLTAYDGTTGHILVVLSLLLLAQIIENQFIRPYFFGKFMDIHPLLVILSILIGAKFFGFAGVILGPAFAGMVCVLVDELYLAQINSGEKQ